MKTYWRLYILGAVFSVAGIFVIDADTRNSRPMLMFGLILCFIGVAFWFWALWSFEQR